MNNYRRLATACYGNIVVNNLHETNSKVISRAIFISWPLLAVVLMITSDTELNPITQKKQLLKRLAKNSLIAV